MPVLRRRAGARGQFAADEIVNPPYQCSSEAGASPQTCEKTDAAPARASRRSSRSPRTTPTARRHDADHRAGPGGHRRRRPRQGRRARSPSTWRPPEVKLQAFDAAAGRPTSSSSGHGSLAARGHGPGTWRQDPVPTGKLNEVSAYGIATENGARALSHAIKGEKLDLLLLWTTTSSSCRAPGWPTPASTRRSGGRPPLFGSLDGMGTQNSFSEDGASSRV